MASYAMNDVETVGARHLHIQENQIGLVPLDRRDCGFTAVGFSDDLYSWLAAQQPQNFSARRRFVVNDQDVQRSCERHRTDCDGGEIRYGTRRITSAPPVTRLPMENSWLAPYNWARRSRMFERPTPRPKVATESIDPSPVPVSETLSTRLPFSRCAAIEIFMTSPPGFIPCRKEFSSKGCRINCGTRELSSEVSTA